MTTRHHNNEHTNDYGPVERSRRFYSIRQAAWTLGVSSDEMARAVRVGTVRTVWRRGALAITAHELTRHLPLPAGPTAPSTGDPTANTLDGLDRYRNTPTDVLARIVVRECAAPLDDLDGESDADLAERICGACRAPLACVELELRLHGSETVGVWGGLPDDQVRALCAGWLERRGRDGVPPEEVPGPMCARCDHAEWVHEAFETTHAYVRPAPAADVDGWGRDG